MSEFKIDGPGFYLQRNGGKAEVFAERDGRWYGMSARYDAMSWKEGGTRCSLSTEYDLVARWPRFAVGDRVRVQSHQCDLYGRYGVVHKVFPQGANPYLVWFDDDSEYFEESALVPDDRPDPGPEHRLLGDDELLEAGDESQEGCDPEPRRWRGPLTNSDCSIGKTVREVNASVPNLQILAWRRRLPKPFRISVHGPGVYETRDGNEVPITERVSEKREAVHVWRGVLPNEREDNWTDAGKYNHYFPGDQPLDLVRYIGPLPKFE